MSSSFSSRKLTAITPAWRGVSKAVSCVFLTRPLRVREQQVLRVLVRPDRQHLRDPLVRLEAQQPRHVTALGVAAALGQLPHLRPVHATLRREEQDPVVRRGREQVLDLVVRTERCPTYTAAAAALDPVLIRLGPPSRTHRA